jgi:calcineurin-like phosphoesterase
MQHGDRRVKNSARRFLDGKVSAVIGTHTHVQTADEQIFPGGTAFLCDAGMCGPVNSILGRAIEPIMNRFISNLPGSFPVAVGEVRLRGALIEIDETTGRALRITRVDEAGLSESAAPEPEPKIDIEQAPSPEQT